MAYYHFARRRVFQLTIAGSATRCLPQTRSFSTPATTSPPTRWLSDLKARLGKCIIFGLPKEQVRRAGQAAKILGEEWRGLIAGREGYLIDSGHEGIVRWGEMVCRTEKRDTRTDMVYIAVGGYLEEESELTVSEGGL